MSHAGDCSFCHNSWQKETWEADGKLCIQHSDTAGGYRQRFEAPQPNDDDEEQNPTYYI